MLGKGKQLLLSIVDTAPAVCHDAINLIFFARQKSFHLRAAIVPERMYARSHDSETRSSRSWGSETSGTPPENPACDWQTGSTPREVRSCEKWKRKSVKMIWVDSSHSETSLKRRTVSLTHGHGPCPSKSVGTSSAGGSDRCV